MGCETETDPLILPLEVIEAPARTKVTISDDKKNVLVEDSKQKIVIDCRRGPQGPMGEATGNFERSFIAAETIPALRFVGEIGGGLRLIDPNDLDARNAGFGISKTAGLAGNMIVVVFGGLMTNETWNWDIKKPILCGANGVLSQDDLIGAKFSQVIGRPVSGDAVLVSVANAIRKEN